MRAFVLTVAAAFLLATPVARSGTKPGCQQARQAIVFYTAATHNWQARHDEPRTAAGHAATSPGCAYVKWSARRWQHRAHAARKDYQTWLRSTYAKWACVHSHEGSWSDERLPQMGGLQFDLGFQSTYGSEFLALWGDAGHWPVWAQLLAAERAFHGYAGYGPRGYGPWPNTAAACGLR